MNFELFKNELDLHGRSGYHVVVSADVEKLTYSPLYLNHEYKDFIQQFGYGSFYNGSLQLFELNSEIFIDFNNQLQSIKSNQYVAIGYNGTTEGCFCLKNNAGDNSIYWIEWNSGDISVINSSFHSFIENTPKYLFNEKVYKGFKKVKNIDEILNVIKQRQNIKVDLFSYELNLVAKPNEVKKYLKRYNKISLKVSKLKNVQITDLTIKILREGSEIGNDNVEYVTIDISKIPVAFSSQVETLVFDPFNVPFKKIVCLYDPNIDLSNSMRVKYKEIFEFL